MPGWKCDDVVGGASAPPTGHPARRVGSFDGRHKGRISFHVDEEGSVLLIAWEDGRSVTVELDPEATREFCWRLACATTSCEAVSGARTGLTIPPPPTRRA